MALPALALENVVRVLDDEGDEKAAEGVQDYHPPDERGVAVEEALCRIVREWIALLQATRIIAMESTIRA